MHEWPLYPGTGRLDDIGAGPGAGATVNFPLPAGATGDVYLDAIDTVVAPLAERFAPTWVLISAGFDAHRADPLTGLGLAAGDYADLTAGSGAGAAPPLRRVPRGRLRPRRAPRLDRRDGVDPARSARCDRSPRPPPAPAGPSSTRPGTCTSPA